MRLISEFCLLLLFLVRVNSIQSYTTCRCITPQDITINCLSNAVQNLNTQMELVKFNLQSMNLNMKLLDSKVSDSKDTFFTFLPDVEHQQPRIYNPYKRVDEKTIDSDKERERSERRKGATTTDTTSYQVPDDVTLNKITDFLKEITKQNKRLTESVQKLESLLTKIPVSDTEDDAMRLHYDKHFTCIKNCNQPASSSKSCSEATAKNSFKDGVYLLDVSEKDLKPFYAYCVHEKANEKGWMIIQRREDGSVNFNRNWMDYKQGFGDLYGEYWIGLDRLHGITKNQPYEIAIVLRDYDGTERYAKYSKFSVGSQDKGYELYLDCYVGNAGDSFKHHNYMKFSTFDNDNDRIFGNCAQIYKGGWWYDGCYFSNLNGAYYSASDKNSGFGVNWYDWHGYDYSLKYSHMAIRPI